MPDRRQAPQAFTLIELLVVISIAMLLMAILLPIASLASCQFWLGLNKEYACQGLLMRKRALSEKALFCPQDQPVDPTAELNKALTASSRDAYGSYLYRQLDYQASVPSRRRLGDLGNNPAGRPVAALILDAQLTLDWPDVPLKSPHAGLRCSVGFINGAARTVPNQDRRLTLRSEDAPTVFERLDAILDAADRME